MSKSDGWGSDADAYRQIGNAIPPVMIWHIVRELKKIDRKLKR